MRTIKFRIYDKISKKHIEDGVSLHAHNEWAINNRGEVISILGSIYSDDVLIERETKYLVAQLSTGFFDKNGREIYEGDILKVENWIYNPEVIWHNGGFIARYSWIEKDIVKHADVGFAYFVGKNIIEIL